MREITALLRSLRLGASAIAPFLISTSGDARSDSPRASEPPSSVQTVAASTWPRFRDAFVERYFEFNPSFAVLQGLHEFDGKLPDWSEVGLRAQRHFLEQSIAATTQLDGSGLSRQHAFERDCLIALARRQLYFIAEADQPRGHPEYYVSNGLDPQVYLGRPYADALTRMKAFIAHAKSVILGSGERGIVDGAGANARLSFPMGIACHPWAPRLYVNEDVNEGALPRRSIIRVITLEPSK